MHTEERSDNDFQKIIYITDYEENKFTLKAYVRKKVGLHFSDPVKWVIDNGRTEGLKRCIFCGELVNFKLEPFVKDNKVYGRVIYGKKDKVCGHHVTETSKNCKSKKLNPNSIEYVSKVFGVSTEEANQIILRRNKSPFYKTNFSSEEEYRKAQSRGVEFYKKKYGDEWEEKYLQANHNKSIGHKYETYVQKYGVAHADELMKKHDSMSIQFHKKKYGKDWKRHYEERCEKCIPKQLCSGSKESLKFFEELSENLPYKMYYGKGKEVHIFDPDNMKLYFYDCFIPDLNLIIEYNGSAFHYNPNWNYTRKPSFVYRLDEEFKHKDDRKIALAKEKFNVIIVWDTDVNKIEKVKNFIKDIDRGL